MQKSIKKVIASAVAALMVISAMPFSALAAVGDYTPDIQVQFTPVFDNEEGYFGDPAMAKSSYDSWQNTGLNCAPLVYDATAGTLTAKADDISGYGEYNEFEYEDVEDVVFEEGAVFAVTVRMDNITNAWGAAADIKFTDNVAPVGIYRTGKKSSEYAYLFATEPTGTSPKEIVAPGAVIDDWSASNLYEGMNDTALGDLSEIQEAPADFGEGWSDQIIHAQYLATDAVDVSALEGENTFYNLATGEFSDDGYDYAGKAIIATFLFQVTGEGAIKFELADPESAYSDVFNGAYYIADKNDGTTAADKTTYAVNKYNAATMKNDGDTEWPGSTKMTFMGKNEFVSGGEDPEPVKYTITFKNADGTDISVTDYEEGEAVTIPELPANTYDDTYHYSYAWNAEPSATATADATYQVVETAEEHDFAAVTDPASTCAVAGKITYTCACGKTYTEDAPLAAHTPGTAVKENDVPSTCKDLGGYDSVVYCSVCNEEISRTHIDYTEYADHTPAAAVKENDVASTCNTLGGYDSVVYCSVCNAEISRTHVDYTEYAAHTPKAAVKENDVPSTCKDLGGYDSVVYCSVCNAELSRTHVDYTEYAAHTPAAAVEENIVPATKKDKGHKDVVVYCSVCNAEISRETVDTDPALGVNITLNKSDIGYAEGLAEGKNNVPYGTAITLTATPVEGATFVGWEIGGNIVSKDATFETTAAYDFTITPVFEDVAANTITVTFYDKYGNTVKQYKDMSVEDYQAAIAADYDTIVAPAYPSYTFKAWDKDKDAILALDASATIWAIYEKIPEEEIAKYTVTTNADLALPAGIVNGQIPYDTQVTVSDAAATAWKIGEAIVAYGTSYTFYVGSDVTIDPVYAEVEEKATVTVIGANLVVGSEYKYNIVATRNVPDGFTLVDYGFVYGKNLTDADLDIEKEGEKGSNADSGNVKVVHAGTRNTESNEFALNYGIKAKNAPVTAKAFIIVTDKNGDTDIVYSDMFTQNY